MTCGGGVSDNVRQCFSTLRFRAHRRHVRKQGRGAHDSIPG